MTSKPRRRPSADERIAAAVASAPPLPADLRARLAEILRAQQRATE